MKNDFFKNYIWLVIFSTFFNYCTRKEAITTFADICQNENQTEVSIRGFLKTPPVASSLTSQSFLLVENENGTGGFIQIEMTNGKIVSKNAPVKVTAEVFKTENSCVLKLTKIETP